ncbi:hypothetical protein TruAng_011687 [Truncatella angustata]|nr:hypothetical protein TruAng_011687 [Truncatella angustata]
MKIKAISRSVEAYAPAGSKATKTPRNLDPAIHPVTPPALHHFERAREYTRALNATKMDRMFAQPFLAQLGDGHVDGVYCLAKDPRSEERFASGSGDGVVKAWDLVSKDEVWHTTAHENVVRGMAWTRDQKLLTCAADRTIKLYDPYNQSSGSAPLSTFLGTSAFTSLSMHRQRNAFAASSGLNISIYDLERQGAAPDTLAWPNAVDTINHVSFNQIEHSILASCASDRSVVLYDLRTSQPLAKTLLNFATNKISWNPMEAFNLATASEDHNVYIFDIRKFDRALNVLKDHVAAVMVSQTET